MLVLVIGLVVWVASTGAGWKPRIILAA